jgi:thiol-disulfide isomerase/thioredoxin
MRKILVIVFIVIGQYSFAQSYEFTLNGQFSEITNQKGTLSYWDVDDRKNTFLDSVSIDENGTLNHISKNEPGLYVLDFKDLGSVYLAVDNKQTVQISIEGKGLKASGSRDIELLNQYEIFRKESLSKWMDGVRFEIKNARKNNEPQKMDSLSLQENKNYASHRTELTQWVESHMGTSIAVYATSLRWSFSDVSYMQRLLPKFKKAHPNLKITHLLEEKINRFSRVAIGQIALDIHSKDSNGKDVSLNTLLGKYVLIDFWASWCGPCRRENPNLVKLYKEYKNQGFEIFGVSIDTRSARWTAAIEKDHLLWTQASDLKGYTGEAPIMYNVSAIPSNVLIDPEGKIIAYNLFGRELEQKLDSIF